MTNLKEINVAANHLTGSIPKEVGDISSIQYLDLYQNHITGPIPSQLGDLTSLLHLDLGNTNLDGSIPKEVGALVAHHNLSYVNLNQSNHLSGKLADEFCDLKPPCSYPLRGAGDALCGIHFDCTDALCGCECPCPIVQEKVP